MPYYPLQLPLPLVGARLRSSNISISSSRFPMFSIMVASLFIPFDSGVFPTLETYPVFKQAFPPPAIISALPSTHVPIALTTDSYVGFSPRTALVSPSSTIPSVFLLFGRISEITAAAAFPPLPPTGASLTQLPLIYPPH